MLEFYINLIFPKHITNRVVDELVGGWVFCLFLEGFLLELIACNILKKTTVTRLRTRRVSSMSNSTGCRVKNEGCLIES